jgi:uncharacterized protein YxjI
VTGFATWSVGAPGGFTGGSAGDDAGVPNYLIKKQVIALGDDFWVQDEDGERRYRIDGKAFRLRKTFVIETVDGEEVAKVQERKLAIHKTMVIERGGQELGTVRKALVSPLRDRFTVELATGGELQVDGDLFDHEFTITRNGAPVAEVSKRWFSVRDSYGLSIASHQDIGLALAVAVAIDAMQDE